MWSKPSLSHQYVLMLLLTSLIVVAANPKRINCRKYVFAPICRGVAAKRVHDDTNEMWGDDPRMYVIEKSFSQLENVNQIKQKPSQGRQWLSNERNHYPGPYPRLGKKPITDFDDVNFNRHI